MNNLLKKLIPPEPFGQCDSNFIGKFQTVRFIQMMSLTFGLFTQVSGSGPLGPLVDKFVADFTYKLKMCLCFFEEGKEGVLVSKGVGQGKGQAQFRGIICDQTALSGLQCLLSPSCPGPGCSKLMTLLVNVSLKFQILIPYLKYANIFC